MMEAQVTTPFEIKDYIRLDQMPHFLCPGCGHGIALRALLWAVHDLSIAKDNLAVVSGIGCSGRLSAYVDANTFHVTHGRPLAYAAGLALARPDLHVIVITGDDDVGDLEGTVRLLRKPIELDGLAAMINDACVS